MANKQTIMRAFNKHLLEFIDDIAKLFPNESDIRTAISSINLIRTNNPTLLIKMWYQKVYTPYREEIDSGDCSNFSNISFKGENNDDQMIEIMKKIHKFIADVSDENRQHTMKYLQILSKLSDVYQTST